MQVFQRNCLQGQDIVLIYSLGQSPRSKIAIMSINTQLIAKLNLWTTHEARYTIFQQKWHVRSKICNTEAFLPLCQLHLRVLHTVINNIFLSTNSWPYDHYICFERKAIPEMYSDVTYGLLVEPHFLFSRVSSRM